MTEDQLQQIIQIARLAVTNEGQAVRLLGLVVTDLVVEVRRLQGELAERRCETCEHPARTEARVLEENLVSMIGKYEVLRDEVNRLSELVALQPCGHPAAAIASSDEGTHYCRWCADIDGALDAGRKEARRVVVPVYVQYWRCPNCNVSVHKSHTFCWNCNSRPDWSGVTP